VSFEKEIEEEIEILFEEIGERVEYKLGTMIEIPRACLLADEIAEYADFFSFGTNDLTQMSMGLSRDDSVKFLDDYREKGIWEGEPFYSIDRKAVSQLVELGVKNGKSAKPNLKIGVCGEHGGDRCGQRHLPQRAYPEGYVGDDGLCQDCGAYAWDGGCPGSRP